MLIIMSKWIWHCWWVVQSLLGRFGSPFSLWRFLKNESYEKFRKQSLKWEIQVLNHLNLLAFQRDCLFSCNWCMFLPRNGQRSRFCGTENSDSDTFLDFPENVQFIDHYCLALKYSNIRIYLWNLPLPFLRLGSFGDF